MSSDDIAIKLERVTKTYSLAKRPADRLSSHVLTTLGNKFGPGKLGNYLKLQGEKRTRQFHVLHNINLEIRKGESYGILGKNGAGKTTLLQIISGVLQPTSGSVMVNGRLAALLALGSGINPAFTGLENIYLQGAILGLKKSEIDQRLEEIIAFADIGEHISAPVKTYSSGMLMRLAFSIQVQVDPEILIVDEAFAVGDAIFRKRCNEKLDELINSGVTFLFVSHSEESVRTLTKKAILIESGRLCASGSTNEVIAEYRIRQNLLENKYLQKLKKVGVMLEEVRECDVKDKALAGKKLSTHYGADPIVLTKIRIMDSKNKECYVFEGNQIIRIEINLKALMELTHLNIGVRLRNVEGVKIYSWGTFNCDMGKYNSGESKEDDLFWKRVFKPGEDLSISFEFESTLGENEYEVEVYVAEERQPNFLDQKILLWVSEAAFFRMNVDRKNKFYGGVVDLDMKFLN